MTKEINYVSVSIVKTNGSSSWTENYNVLSITSQNEACLEMLGIQNDNGSWDTDRSMLIPWSKIIHVDCKQNAGKAVIDV